jgi:hypothetical protein
MRLTFRDYFMAPYRSENRVGTVADARQGNISCRK